MLRTRTEMSARWIWLPGAPRGIDVFVFARRVFDAPGGGEHLRITCDGRYVACLNGVEIGCGPARSEPRDLTFDEYEVSLRPGTNVVGVLARNYGRPALYWKPGGPGGLLAEIEGLISTGASWKVRRAPYTPVVPAASEGAPDPEVIDGRAWPHGWLDASFDDSAWSAAAEIPGPPLGSLPPREIAFLAERVLTLGTAEMEAGGARTFDLGTITNAHVILRVEGAPGTEVEVRAGEDADGDVPLLDVRDWFLRYTTAGAGGASGTGLPSFPGGRPVPHEANRHSPDASGAGTFEEVEAFEPVGFRYVRIRADAPCRIEVRARERTYPRPAGASFRCSDPALEAIWEAGARTLDLCSTDAFIDCPGREQRAWLGDDYVTSLVSMTVSPDVSLVAHDLRLHAAGQRSDGLLPMVAAGDFTGRAHTIPDYSLLWIGTLARVYEHTGDLMLARDLLPVARGILDAFEAMRAPDGLIGGYVHGLEGWWFIDWAQIQRGDRIAAVDAMYAMALSDAAALSEAAGEDPTPFRARHAATCEAFERYWEGERGVYVDAAYGGDRVETRDEPKGGAATRRAGRRVSQQTNSAAICASLVPGDRLARVVERITDPARLRMTLTPGDGGSFGERLNRQWEDPPGFDDDDHVVLAQPFFAHFLHRALVHAGRRDLLLPSIRRWGEMVSRNGLVEEYWRAEPGMGSRCHAWSATPTYDLTAHVLGVRPGAPGWRTVIVDPHLGDLDWTEGGVPTPLGWVRVRAERGRAPQIDLPARARLADPARGGM